jgi:2-aminobenzoate-CoA ligase
MRKYEGLRAAEMPDIIRALPELHYPERLNIARALLEGALTKGFGARVAYHCNGRRFTYAMVHREVHRYANALRRLGVREGEAVVLRQQDSAELIFSILAVQAIGAIAVPTYAQLRAQDLAYRINDSGAGIMLVDSALLAEAQELPSACATLRHIVVASAALSGEAVTGSPHETRRAQDHDPTSRFVSLASLLEDGDPRVDYADTHAEDVTLILYTSGSTGLPKATSHAHADLLATPDSYRDYCLGMQADDVVAGPPAIPFALGLDFFVLYTLRSGASAVLSPDKTPHALLAAMVTFGVTIVVGVSTYYNRLGQLICERGLKLPALRIALCGGEPLPLEVERAWAQATGVPLEQFLGTTELLNIFIGLRHGATSPKPGAMGRPVPGYEVSIRDVDTFQPVRCGAPGLLCVRGPTGTRYLNNPEAQSKTVRDGWNVFQDLVAWDEDGFLVYLARRDEMIVSGGHSISPVEVEQVLMQHPYVAECACTAAPDRTGRRPSIVKAYIVLKSAIDRTETTKRELQDFFKRSAPPFMYPREIEFTDSLPRTLNGKIQRLELRRLAARDAQA